MDTDTDDHVAGGADVPASRKDAQFDLPAVADPGARRPARPRAKRSKAVDLPVDPTEGQIHVTVAELLDWVLRPPALYTTFPAGWGKLTKGTAGRLYASGLKRGYPDIVIHPGGGRTIGIELKSPTGSLTTVQRDMHAKLNAAGIPVYVCRCTADVIAVLNRENVPFRYVRS
jgi:hypothetical protein